MSGGELIAVVALGGAGAVARFLLDGAVSRRAGREFPYGTLAVNVLGAFLLGALAGAGASTGSSRLLGTGFIGAFTTFSTWALESHRLGEEGRLRSGGLNFLLSLALGLGAAWLGRELGGVL